MKHKKAAFDVQNFMITFVIVSAMLVTFGGMAYQMSMDYSPQGAPSVNQTFGQSYNKLEDIAGDVQSMQGKMDSVNTNDYGTGVEVFSDALGALKLFFNSMVLSNQMIMDMSEILGIPAIWVTALTFIIVILVITTILFMVVKFR